MSIHYVHQNLSSIKVCLPHQQKREPQRTPARKRTESPRHGQGTEFQGKVDGSKRWNASRRTTFIEWSIRDSIVLACYGHARWYTSTARQKKVAQGWVRSCMHADAGKRRYPFCMRRCAQLDVDTLYIITEFRVEICGCLPVTCMR